MPYHLQKVSNGWFVIDDVGKRHSKKPFRTKKDATQQLKALWASYHQRHPNMKGKGFFQNVYQKVKRVVNRAVDTYRQMPSIRVNYPPYTREALARFGDGRIIGLTIARTPIMSVINEALNIITQNKWDEAKRKVGYDSLFHVALLVDLELANGVKKRLVVEKNAVINITDRFTQNEHTEIFPLSTPSPPITLHQMLEGARRAMGDSAYFGYEAFSNNCQVYLQNLLQSAGVLTPEAKAFLFQPTEELVKELPFYTRFATKAITSLGAWVDRLIYGNGRTMLRGGIRNDYELELDADQYPEEQWIFKYMRQGEPEDKLKRRIAQFWRDQYQGQEPDKEDVDINYEELRKDFYRFLRLYPFTEEGPPTPVSLASNVERDLVELREDDDIEDDAMDFGDDADLLNFTDEEDEADEEDEEDDYHPQMVMPMTQDALQRLGFYPVEPNDDLHGGMFSPIARLSMEGHATVMEGRRLYHIMKDLQAQIAEARRQGIPYGELEVELRRLVHKYQAIRRELERSVQIPMRDLLEGAEDREYVQQQNIAHQQERREGRGTKPKKWIQEVTGEKGFHEGAFTAQAKRAKMSTIAFAKHVLANPSAFHKKTVQRARFFQNVSKQF